MADGLQQISSFLLYDAESCFRRAREMERDLHRGKASIQRQFERHPFSEWLGYQMAQLSTSFEMGRIGDMSFHTTGRQRLGRKWEIASLETFSGSLALVTRERELGDCRGQTALCRRSLRDFELSPRSFIDRFSPWRRRVPPLLAAG